MTALLHRLLHDHRHARPAGLPTRVRISPAPWNTVLGNTVLRNPVLGNGVLGNTVLAAAGERLATRSELDTMRSLHPRRIAAGR